MKRILVRLVGLLGSAAIIGGVLLVSNAAGAAPSWRYIGAVRTDEAGSRNINLWVRGTDAVLRELDGAVLVGEKRCIDGTLSEEWDNGRVVRELADRDECFNLVTGSLLGYVRAALGPTFRPTGRRSVGGISDAAVFKASSARTETASIVVDERRGLPLVVEARSGRITTWRYEAVGSRRAAPSAAPRELPTETYRDLPAGDAREALGIASLPASIDGIPLEGSFSYTPAERQRSVYGIWRTETGREIQLVVTYRKPGPSDLGFEDLGGTVVVRFEEAGTLVQISAPDRATLRHAARVLRPSLVLPREATQ